MSKKSIKDNINFIDNANGRKWSWGNFKYLGEFTAIDFIIFGVTFLLTIPLFFIPNANIMALVLWTVFAFMMCLIIVKEFKGRKLYERVWNSLIFIFKPKDINLKEFFVDNDNVYEVLNGFDLSNLKKEDISKIDNQINDFFASIEGNIKIFKFNATFRMDEAMKYIAKNVDKNKNKKKILYSYLENIESFKKSKMPNIYIKFINMEEREIKKSLSILSGVLTLQKIEEKKWIAIKMSNFSLFKNELKYVSERKKITNDADEKTVGVVAFNRNVKSNYLEELIFNNNISFVAELKNPSYEESIKIKKSIKRWSKTITQDDYDEIKGKDFFELKNKAESKEAKNNVMIDLIMGKDELRLMNVYFIFSRDKENDLSLKKQLQDLNWKLEKRFNFSLDTYEGKQDDILREFFLDESQNKRWYPINVSTFTNSMPFQNESFLDNGGGYIGTSSYLFPFVFNAWKTGTSGRHMGILAKTGGGKTILMKKLIASDQVLQNSIQYVLDPKNDGFGESVIHKLGGSSINVSDTYLNPMKLSFEFKRKKFENEDKQEIEDLKIRNNLMKEIRNKSIEIQEFLYILFEKESKHYQIVNSISKFSDKLKIFFSSNWENILEGKEYTFSDFKNYLGEKSKEFDFIFEKLIKGTYSIFNNKDSLVLGKKSIVFELHEVLENPSKEVSNATMFLILNKIIDEIYNRQDKKKNLSLWIDEAGDFFKSDFLTKKLEKLMVKSRSFNTKICWATQNPTDLLGDKNKSLASIFANTEHLFIGQLKDGQIGAVNEMFKLAEADSFSDSEKEHIKDSASIDDKGKFIYINSSQRHLIQVDYDNDFILKMWIEDWKRKNNRE